MDTDEELFSSDESGISEQDLIEHVDILFRTSDLEGSGYVPVSRIIEYLRVQTSFGEVCILCPNTNFLHKYTCVFILVNNIRERDKIFPFA